jgi:hypothetical protein
MGKEDEDYAPKDGRASLMQDLKWLDKLPDRSIEGGVALVSRLGWNLETEQTDGTWRVRAGEDCIFTTDDADALRAFLYGLALGYSVLPPDVIKKIQQFVADCGL